MSWGQLPPPPPLPPAPCSRQRGYGHEIGVWFCKITFHNTRIPFEAHKIYFQQKQGTNCNTGLSIDRIINTEIRTLICPYRSNTNIGLFIYKEMFYLSTHLTFYLWLYGHLENGHSHAIYVLPTNTFKLYSLDV